MPALAIQLLGDFRLTWNGASITSVNSPRLQSLLAYLILHYETPQLRQHLAFLFWPDTSETNARNNFRQLLFELRRALPEANQFLDAEGVTIRWRAEAACTCDALDFQSLLSNTKGIPDARAPLEQAIALYRGDLLPGCYDDWIIPVRDQLRLQVIEALHKLLAVLEEADDYAAAIQHAQNLLRHDPLDEAAYRRLMRFHALCGDRAGVVRVHNTCVTVLKQELGIEPSPETQRAYEDALNLRLPSRSATESLTPTASSRNNNLPLQLTRFIGREREMAAVSQWVMDYRLVTLTGAGGVGKTRLALAVATRLLDKFPDGVWWVDLAPLDNPALHLQTIARAMGVREVPGHSLQDTLLNYMRDKNLMLVVDNCEHMIENIARDMPILLQAAPGLRMLLTSREILQIPGERSFRVPSLELPALEGQDPRIAFDEMGTAARQCESVQLFLDRAVTALPTFAMTRENIDAINQICQRLDGIPLAIELAAARVPVLSPHQIASRLGDRFNLLTSGDRTALPHHQTLRALLDWSYDFLSEPERVLLRRLAVFSGGWTLEAAEAVGGCDPLATNNVLDLLARLVDKSLVVAEQKENTSRYRMLETIRQYAQEKLIRSGEAETVKARHLDYFVRWAEQSPQGWYAYEGFDWLKRFEAERENWRTALEWSMADEAAAQAGLKLVARLAHYLELEGHYAEVLDWFKRLVAKTGESIAPLWRAEAMLHTALAEHYTGEYAAARTSAAQGLALFRELRDPSRLGEMLASYGLILNDQGELATARPFFEESLSIYQQLGDSFSSAWVLLQFGITVYLLGDPRLGHAYLEQGLELSRKGKWSSIHGRSAGLLGELFRQEGNLAQAKALYKEAVTALHVGEDWVLAMGVDAFASMAIAEGLTIRAATLLGASDRIYEDSGMARTPIEQTKYDSAIGALRAALNYEAFANAWAKGHAMTREEAVACAVEETGGPPP